jgi:hypothetical protein
VWQARVAKARRNGLPRRGRLLWEVRLRERRACLSHRQQTRCAKSSQHSKLNTVSAQRPFLAHLPATAAANSSPLRRGVAAKGGWPPSIPSPPRGWKAGARASTVRSPRHASRTPKMKEQAWVHGWRGAGEQAGECVEWLCGAWEGGRGAAGAARGRGDRTRSSKTTSQPERGSKGGPCCCRMGWLRNPPRSDRQLLHRHIEPLEYLTAPHSQLSIVD